MLQDDSALEPPVLGAVEGRLADEPLDGNLAVRVRQHGPLGGELERSHPVLPDVAAEHGEGGGAAELERHRRREVGALLLHEVDEVVAIEVEAGRAHGDGLVGVDGSAEVERAFVEVVAADGEAQVVVRLEARTLRHEIDDPARGDLAVEHGRRPLEDLDPLHAEELLADPEPGIGPEPVQEDRIPGEEAANREAVEAAPAVLVEHAGHPLERLGQGQELLGVELLPVEHVDGRRHLDEGGVRLGARGRVLHAVPLVQEPANGHRVQRDGILGPAVRGWRRRLARVLRLGGGGDCSEEAQRDGQQSGQDRRRRRDGSKAQHVGSPGCRS